MLVQNQPVRVLFALSEAGNPNNPVNGATFSGAEIRVVKATTGAISNATNQAATVNGGEDGGVIGVGGNTGLYSILLTAAELSLGLAPGQVGIVSLIVDKLGAVPRGILAWYVTATAPGSVSTDGITAIAMGVANQVPDTGDITAIVDAAVDPLPSATAAAVAAAVPTAAENAAAVGALTDADGVSVLAHQAMTGAMLYGPGTFPENGAFEARSLDGSKARVAGTVAATTGVRAVTTRDGA